MLTKKIAIFILSFCVVLSHRLSAQTNVLPTPDTQWFRDAKFGLFIHWGLFAQHGGMWNGKRYYGISEWLPYRAHPNLEQYRKLADVFNPVQFDANAWVKLAKQGGIKYMVVTTKHHDGFAMYDSKVSSYNIMHTPFKRDPMKELSKACQQQGMQLGFYYSQFLDWNEPNGGGNDWDFNEQKKNYQQYYQAKSIPQIKELLSSYGPLGLIWFDMPGGMTGSQTQAFISQVRQIQPNCLISSRVGQGLGDFRTFGDGEVPNRVVREPWEAIFTHNDSWGYSAFDYNFKSPREVIHLLAKVVSLGGNLMLNVGPKADGSIPDYSAKTLQTVGNWLGKHGDAIYGTTYGFLPPQPWGVTTRKVGKLFLHILQRPENNVLLVPNVSNTLHKVYFLSTGKALSFKQTDGSVTIRLPEVLPDAINSVIVIEHSGILVDAHTNATATISPQFEASSIEVSQGVPSGRTKLETLTSRRYFGDWKYNVCATQMSSTADSIHFDVHFTEPGDYKIALEYSNPASIGSQEGELRIGSQRFPFETLLTGDYHQEHPLLFIQQSVALVNVSKSGSERIRIAPLRAGKELFKLNRIIIESVR